METKYYPNNDDVVQVLNFVEENKFVRRDKVRTKLKKKDENLLECFDYLKLIEAITDRKERVKGKQILFLDIANKKLINFVITNHLTHVPSIETFRKRFVKWYYSPKSDNKFNRITEYPLETAIQCVLGDLNDNISYKIINECLSPDDCKYSYGQQKSLEFVEEPVPSEDDKEWDDINKCLETTNDKCNINKQDNESIDLKDIFVPRGFDNVTTHYTCAAGYDAIKVIEDFNLNFNIGNAVKYLLRYTHKGTIEDSINDLKKAINYISREISYAETKK